MLGKIVRTRRRQLGLTQEELAGKTQLSARSIRDIETGRTANPRPRTIRLLADALRLDSADRTRLLASGSHVPTRENPPAAPDHRVGAEGIPTTELPPPAQLPADLAAFVGRTAELAQLDALLPGNGSAPAPAVVTGPVGIGKTTLAVHWGHQVANRFPAGQLYVDLHGFGPSGSPMRPYEVIREFLDAFAITTGRIPSGEQAQAGLYRSILAGRRMLVILDNARDADQVRPLLPGSPGCLALVTSRSQLTSLVTTDGARSLTLNLPSLQEAREMLARRLGARRVAAEPAAVDELINRCGRLPLAIAIIAACAAVQPQLPLVVLARRLREDARGGLDTLANHQHPAADVRRSFSWSYRALNSEAAGLFRLLGRHPDPDLTASAVARLLGTPAEKVPRLLAELTHLHLLTESTPGRYTLHRLVHAYAAELADG